MKYVRELWRETREWSLEELRDMLEMLDVKIDVWFYESEVDEPSKVIVDELIAKDIATDERPQGGAVIVKIDEKLGTDQGKISHECYSAQRWHNPVSHKRPGAGKGQV